MTSGRIEAVQPVLGARDVEVSLRFFARLGFGEIFRDRDEAPRYAAVARDGIELHLQWYEPTPTAPDADRTTYRFLVVDIDALFAELERAGAILSSSSPWARPGDTPWGTREFHLRDPDGNGLQFYAVRSLRVQAEPATRGVGEPVAGAATPAGGRVLDLDHMQVAMPPGGEAAARAFYGTLLGLREIPKPANLLARGGVWFALGERELHLGIEADFRPARKAHPALRVDHLDAVLDRCRAAGVAVVDDEPLPVCVRAYVADPFGNRIELLQRLGR